MNKFTLITGASGGIGQEIARKLASEGYNLYLHYHQNEESLGKLIKELEAFKGTYIPIRADLTQKNGYKTIAASILNIDAIVHCSGNSHYGMLLDLTEEDLEKLLRIHVTSPLLLTKELLPKLLTKKNGSVVVISSIWGQVGASCEVAYSSVKGAQIAFVKALSKELALSGIRVNGVAPGAIKTQMMKGFSEEEIEELEEVIPMGRMGLPEEVANGVSFLVSDQSSYMTGQILSINGGWHT